MSVLDERRLNLTMRRMREIKSENPDGKDHLRIARRALDQILKTKEYEFGIVLFDHIAKNFTEVRDDLKSMQDMIVERRDMA